MRECLDPKLSRQRPARVTAAEVAERAGTSTATVSLVVNGKTAGRVSQANIDRVLAAVHELGYVVDHTASSLAKGTSNIVILVAPDLSNPFYGRVISGIKAELGNEYQLLLSVTGEGRNPSAADVHRLVALRPAGLLVEAPDDEFLRDLPAGAPLVLLDAPGRETQAPTVNFDLTGGIGALLDHLAAQGHTRIGYLDSLTRTETFELRRTLIEQRGGQARHRVRRNCRGREPHRPRWCRDRVREALAAVARCRCDCACVRHRFARLRRLGCGARARDQCPWHPRGHRLR